MKLTSDALHLLQTSEWFVTDAAADLKCRAMHAKGTAVQVHDASSRKRLPEAVWKRF